MDITTSPSCFSPSHEYNGQENGACVEKMEPTYTIVRNVNW